MLLSTHSCHASTCLYKLYQIHLGGNLPVLSYLVKCRCYYRAPKDNLQNKWISVQHYIQKTYIIIGHSVIDIYTYKYLLSVDFRLSGQLKALKLYYSTMFDALLMFIGASYTETPENSIIKINVFYLPTSHLAEN